MVYYTQIESTAEEQLVYEITNLKTGERARWNKAEWVSWLLGVDNDIFLWSIEEHGACTTENYHVEEV